MPRYRIIYHIIAPREYSGMNSSYVLRDRSQATHKYQRRYAYISRGFTKSNKKGKKHFIRNGIAPRRRDASAKSCTQTRNGKNSTRSPVSRSAPVAHRDAQKLKQQIMDTISRRTGHHFFAQKHFDRKKPRSEIDKNRQGSRCGATAQRALRLWTERLRTARKAVNCLNWYARKHGQCCTEGCLKCHAREIHESQSLHTALRQTCQQSSTAVPVYDTLTVRICSNSAAT